MVGYGGHRADVHLAPHAFGDLDGEIHIVYLRDDALLDEDDGIDDLREDGEVHPVGEALDCIPDAVCMDDPDHAEAGESHVGKDSEVLGLPELVKDDEVRPDKQEHVGGVRHAAVEHGVLGDLVRHLEFAGSLHGLDDEPLSERNVATLWARVVFPDPGAPAMMSPRFSLVILFVMISDFA